MSRLELRLASCALGAIFAVSGAVACTESIPPPIPDSGTSVQFFDAAQEADAARSDDGEVDAAQDADAARSDDGGVDAGRVEGDGST
jgi:hypothetical protein